MIYLVLIVGFLIILFSVINDTDSQILSKEKTVYLKGICAFIILIHHIVQEIENLPIILYPLKYIAFPIVSLFLFFSGYGLMQALKKNNNNYLKNFFKNRYLKILIPYITVVFIYLIYLYISTKKVNIIIFASNIIFATNIGPLWYMTTILIIYLLFYLIYNKFNLKIGTNVFLIISIIYILIGLILNIDSHWLASIIGFWFGLYYSLYPDKIHKYKKQFYKIVIIFILLYILRLIIALKITDIEIFHTPYRNILCILFIYIIIIKCMDITFKNKILYIVGSISYEIYLVHPFLIALIKKYLDINFSTIFLIIFFTIIFAYILNALSKLVYNFLMKSK